MKTYMIYVKDRKTLIEDLKRSQTLKADAVKVFMTHETPLSQNQVFGIVANLNIPNAKIINRFDKPIRFTIKPEQWVLNKSEFGRSNFKATIKSYKFRDITYEASIVDCKSEDEEEIKAYEEDAEKICGVTSFDGSMIITADGGEDVDNPVAPAVALTIDIKDVRRTSEAPFFRRNEYLATAKTAPTIIVDKELGMESIVDATYPEIPESYMEETD